MTYEVLNSNRQSPFNRYSRGFKAKSDRGAKIIFRRNYPILGSNTNSTLYRVAKNGKRVFVEST